MIQERTYPPVLTKSDFAHRYAKGEFGNAAPTWETLDEFLESDYAGLVHLRNRVKGGPTWYNIEPEDVEATYNSVIKAGLVNPSKVYFSGMAPTSKTIIQGEILQTECGLALYYSQVAKPMREALAIDARKALGIIAIHLLRRYLCPNSYEWIQTLLDRYPFHVIEFSTFSVDWGTLPNFNTVFWEVRYF